ncbi:TetR family transcriptional regulator [Solirubrobacter ginsenosidimutans]|uniref:TetR family transcriptional regulator n=1 Tax=Solirubrobacter ginsenosidimutans TaxID=490573 RepID=A0A9X3MTA1_9ACTN|nr:TetR family transcriptional regulator [Solirubrobacter ginsenosidimutans]MDA0161456.1 TetR family transcriptional regulator [Solirubrobacter ginsenosidimutans]
MAINLTLSINFLSMYGLRERKKAATRAAISDVATRLFEARGFEAVTVADIAAAADVSKKTVFNYFPAKEDLFFDAEDAVRDALVAAAPGSVRPLLLGGPMLGSTACTWRDFSGDLYEGMRIWSATEHASPALTARRLVITQSWVEPLSAASGSEAWAAMFVGIVNLRNATFATALLEHRAPRTIQRRLRTVVGGALDALDRAFA